MICFELSSSFWALNTIHACVGCKVHNFSGMKLYRCLEFEAQVCLRFLAHRLRATRFIGFGSGTYILPAMAGLHPNFGQWLTYPSIHIPLCKHMLSCVEKPGKNRIN